MSIKVNLHIFNNILSIWRNFIIICKETCKSCSLLTSFHSRPPGRIDSLMNILVISGQKYFCFISNVLCCLKDFAFSQKDYIKSAYFKKKIKHVYIEIFLYIYENHGRGPIKKHM